MNREPECFSRIYPAEEKLRYQIKRQTQLSSFDMGDANVANVNSAGLNEMHRKLL